MSRLCLCLCCCLLFLLLFLLPLFQQHHLWSKVKRRGGRVILAEEEEEVMPWSSVVVVAFLPGGSSILLSYSSGGVHGNWRLYCWQLRKRRPLHRGKPLGVWREGKYGKRCQCWGNWLQCWWGGTLSPITLPLRQRQSWRQRQCSEWLRPLLRLRLNLK